MAVIRIAIGVFAHNEQLAIERTLYELSRQSLIAKRDHYHTTLFVLANGCSDATCIVADRAVRKYFADLRARDLIWVEDLATPGKSRTWNHFVESLAPSSTDFFIFIDADIELPQASTLADLIEYLVRNPAVDVATSRATKSIELRAARNPFEWLSKQASLLSQSKSQHAVAGSLYCMRSSRAHSITMPIGLLVEDGFVRLATSTDGFLAHPDDDRIQRVPGTFHVFHACQGLLQTLRHERRLVIGTLQNFAIWNWIKSLPADTAPRTLINELNVVRETWTHDILVSYAARLGRMGVLRFAWHRAFDPLQQLSAMQRCLRLPIAITRLIFTGLAGMLAISALKRGDIRW